MADVQILSQEDQMARRIYIDGVAVDSLLESVFRSRKSAAEAKGILVSFELIAWDTVTAAADRDLLKEVLQSALTIAIDETMAGSVIMRAYPSHEDVCVTFEIADTRPDPVSPSDLQRWDEQLEPIKRVVERMAGEWNLFRRREGGLSVCISLPQWVTCDMGLREPKQTEDQMSLATLAA
jgi:hypothetical protein